MLRRLQGCGIGIGRTIVTRWGECHPHLSQPGKAGLRINGKVDRGWPFHGAGMYREVVTLFWRLHLLKGFRALFVAAIFSGFTVGGLAQAAQTPPQNPTPPDTPRVYTPPVVAPSDTLTNVKYDYRWELYGGLAYSHFNAGPTLLQGANLGGFDIQAARFLTRRWAAAANVRGYYGTSGAAPNPYGIRGPFVSQSMFMVGPELRGPSNQHASMTFHALVGAAYGNFESALYDQKNNKVDPDLVGFFGNQTILASAIGGSIDLNRSPRLVFRISPDATLTNYGGTSYKEQFAISVGLVYRLGKAKSLEKHNK